MDNNPTFRSQLRPLIILGLGTLFYVYGFTLRIMPSAMTHELMRGFDINAQTLGILVGLMYWGYTLMQIPSGLLYDRFSSRHILTVTLLICSTGTLILGATQNITIACIGSFVMGLGEAFGFVGVLVLAARWFPPKYFALIVPALLEQSLVKVLLL
jgi:predicted MFS family arabinose efflux permease